MFRNDLTLLHPSAQMQYEPVAIGKGNQVVMLYIAQNPKSRNSEINIQGYTVTPSIPISSSSSHVLESSNQEQKHLKGYFLQNDNLVLTWAVNMKDGSGYGVYSTILKLDAANSNQYSVVKDGFRVNTYTKSNQHSPSVTALSNGDFVIVWQSYGQDTNTNTKSQGVFGQRYSQDGSALGQEFQINDYTADNQQRPVVSSLSSGKFIVVWQSFGQDGSANGVFAKLYKDDGNAASGEWQINTYTDGNQENPSVSSLDNGNVVITWQSFKQGELEYGIFGQIIDSEGQKLGSEFQISEMNQDGVASDTNDISINKNVNIISTVNGFVVTWQGYNKDKKSYDIYVKEFSNNGSVINSAEKVNDESKYSQQYPNVAKINDNGEYAIAWQGFGINSYSYEAAMKVYSIAKLPIAVDGTTNLPLLGSQESSVDVLSTAAPFVPSTEVTNHSTSAITDTGESKATDKVTLSATNAPNTILGGASSISSSTELSTDPSGNIQNETSVSEEVKDNSGNQINGSNANIEANSNNDDASGMGLDGIVGVVIGSLAVIAIAGFGAYRSYKHWNKVADEVETLQKPSSAPDAEDIDKPKPSDIEEMKEMPQHNKDSIAGTPVVSPGGSPYNSPVSNSLSGSSPGSKFGSLDATPSTTNSIDMSSGPISSVKNLFSSNEPIDLDMGFSREPIEAFSAPNIDSDNSMGSNVMMGESHNPLASNINGIDTNVVG